MGEMGAMGISPGRTFYPLEFWDVPAPGDLVFFSQT
jgi:hypothetical protein